MTRSVEVAEPLARLLMTANTTYVGTHTLRAKHTSDMWNCMADRVWQGPIWIESACDGVVNENILDKAYVVTNLNSGSTYNFWVQSHNSFGISAYSDDIQKVCG